MSDETGEAPEADGAAAELLDASARALAERHLALAEATSKIIAEMTLRAQQQQTEAIAQTAEAVERLLTLPARKARNQTDSPARRR
jgi:hypothetical protein